MQIELEPLEEFIESLGLQTEADGMPRIAGRMLGLLIVEEGPFRFDQLAERLQVSRGSVSTNTRLLEKLGMIERFTVPGERRDLFRLRQDVYGKLLEGHLERLQRMQEVVERCRGRLAEPVHPASERLASMSRFYALAIRNTRAILDEWRAHTTESHETEPAATASSR